MFHSIEKLKSQEFDYSFQEFKLVNKFIQIANEKFRLKALGKQFVRDYLTVVKLYAIFKNVTEIDNVKEQFVASIYVEASWEDNTICENDFDIKKYWTPKIYIENVVSKLKEEVKYRIERINTKTIVHEMRHIEARFWEKLELSDFPVDIQDLGIEITSERSINEIQFEPCTERESIINKESFTLQQEWNLYSKINTEKTNFNDVWKQYNRPIYKISCKISRKPGYYFNNVLMMVFLMSVLGCITFSFDVTKPYYRIAVILTLILSSTNFRLVVTQRLPNLSYLTSLDIYAISGIVFLGLLCCWHAIIGSPIFENSSRNYVDDIMLYITISLFVTFNIVYIAVFVYKYSKYKKIERIFTTNKIKPNNN